MMKVIFWAYREWGVRVFDSVERHPCVEQAVLCKSREEVLALKLEDYELLLTCGLSEELGNEIVSRIKAIGVHCAELDRYSYGTPLQLQIIDGIKYTKHRIFSFTYDENSTRAHTHDRLYANEVTLDLSGNMSDICEQLTVTSKVLFHQYLDEYPNNIWKSWPEEDIVRAKRVPSDSCLHKNDLIKMNTEELYNFFRCLEDPYPNGYIEDDKGRLYVERVRYKKHDRKKIRVTFCGYRSWALKTINAVQETGIIEVVDIIKDEASYKEKVLQYAPSDVDCIVFIGWSWIIKDDTLNRFLCVGIHPSDLPMYRGGSPIQHQIIAGLDHTQISLMTISPDGIDVGDIWGKEDWDMRGSTMSVVFDHLADSSIRLLQKFFESFSTLVPVKQNLDAGSYFNRRKKEESRVTWAQLSEMKLKDVYNLIRALTDPYPNIYIQDDEGNILQFKEVEYIKNESSDAASASIKNSSLKNAGGGYSLHPII